MTRSGDVELRWANKHLELQAAGDVDYKWAVPEMDSRASKVGLHEVADVGNATSEDRDGLVILGDALDALRVLRHRQTERPRHTGIRLAYIDPPFNTGRTFSQYDDSLADSVWLSMLRDRLNALAPLLAPFGSVWVHLDDAQQHRARCVLDEVFGEEAFVSTIVWQKRTTRESRSAFSSTHDYIHVYAPAGPQEWKLSRKLLPKGTGHLRNRDGDPRGPWADAPFTAPGYRANQQYPLTNPAGDVLRPPKGRSWYATKPVYDELLQDDRIWFPRNGAGMPRMKMFPEHLRGLVPLSLWDPGDAGTNDEAKRHLMNMFPDLGAFETPKPEPLLQRIIHIGSDPGDLIVDFFAGSGTTAAVAHKMGRRWIAVERATDTVTSFLVPRLASVVAGTEDGGITGRVAWRGGGSFAIAQCGLSPEADETTSDKLREAAKVRVKSAAYDAENAAPPGSPRSLTLFGDER